MESRGLSNTNKLIRTYKGATGLKTGSTGLALYNLSASATRDGMSLIAVIMKAPSTKVRFSEAQKLLDYGFNNFIFKEFGKKDDIVKTINVDKSVQNSLNLVLEQTTGVLVKKDNINKIEQVVNIEEEIIAPIYKGQKLGSMKFMVDGKEIASVNIVAEKNIDKINVFTMSKKVYYKWVDLLRNNY